MAKELKTAAWGSLCSCRAIIDSCWQIIAHRCRCWRIIKDGYCCLYTHCLLTLLASSLWRLNFFYWNALQLLFEPDAHNDLLNLFKNHQDASDLHFSLRLWMFLRCHHLHTVPNFYFLSKKSLLLFVRFLFYESIWRSKIIGINCILYSMLQVLARCRFHHFATVWVTINVFIISKFFTNNVDLDLICSFPHNHYIWILLLAISKYWRYFRVYIKNI